MKTKITAAVAAKELTKRGLQRFDISSILFGKQLDFVHDSAPFKSAVCSRRSGKTVACAVDLLDTATRHSGVVCLYITLSRNNAKKIVWKELKKYNRVYKLGGSVNETELSITFANGSTVYCSGAKDKSEIEKFRGLALKKVYIDECQSFRAYIEDLINDIIAPALLDYAGTLVLIGTPGPVPAGYFYDCTLNEQWSHHAWTFFDNPFIEQTSGQTHMALLQRELKRRGLTLDHPSIQREYFGKWMFDPDSLLLHYNASKNDYAIAPTEMTYIMGIDLGYIDADALAIIGWHDNSPDTYLVEEVVVEKQGLTELVEQINILNKKYKVSKMIIDEGGLGKKLAEEMRRRHQLPVQPAEKQRKMENIAFLNDALRTGRFKARANSKFAQDTYLVEIDKDKTTPDRIRVRSNYHSDIIDAVLYAFKASPAYSYQEPIVPPPKNSQAYFDKLAEELEEQAEAFFAEQVEADQNDPFY